MVVIPALPPNVLLAKPTQQHSAMHDEITRTCSAKQPQHAVRVDDDLVLAARTCERNDQNHERNYLAAPR